jgi:hypothetical protein
VIHHWAFWDLFTTEFSFPYFYPLLLSRKKEANTKKNYLQEEWNKSYRCLREKSKGENLILNNA